MQKVGTDCCTEIHNRHSLHTQDDPFEVCLDIIPRMTAEEFKPLIGYVYCNPLTDSF